MKAGCSDNDRVRWKCYENNRIKTLPGEPIKDRLEAELKATLEAFITARGRGESEQEAGCRTPDGFE